MSHAVAHKTFEIPSQTTLTIRESNGDDEGVLSDTDAAQNDSLNVRMFLSNIIEKGPNGTKLTPEDFKNWKTNDYYYTILAQREFNLGADFSFDFQCTKTTCLKTHDYEENIEKFLVKSFKDPAYAKGPFEFTPAPYPANCGDSAEFKIFNGKHFRFYYLTNDRETMKDLQDGQKSNMNTSILQRGLEIRNGDNWVPVKFFRDFNAREMSAIRSNITSLDPQWLPMVYFSCPSCKTLHSANLMFLPGFYYPVEKI